MKEFFLLVFALFVFAHHEGSCLSEDPPFSAVRHLRQHQKNNVWSEHLSAISRSGVAIETRAGRPLFSWDLSTVSPTRSVTFDENQNNTKLNGSSEVLKADTKKQKRKKEQNRKKKKVSTALEKDQDNPSGSLDRNSSLRTVSTSLNSENNNVPDTWLTGVGQRRQKNKLKKEKNKGKKKKPKIEDIKDEKVKKENKRKKDKKNREQGVRQGKKRRKEEQISDNFLPHVSREDKFIKNRSKNKFKEEENIPELIPALPSSSENIVDAMTGRHKKKVQGNKLNLAGINIDTMDANNEINRREYPQLQELEMNKSADPILISTEDNTLSLEIPLFMLNENTARLDDKLKETDLLENNFILTTDPAGTSTSIEKSHITTSNQEITTEHDNITRKNNVPEKSKVAQTEVLKETGSHILESGNISDSEHLGDLSCLSGTFLPAPFVANAAIKYTRGKYLEAEYECQTDYKLEPAEARVLVCSKRQWLGDLPQCVPLNEVSSTSSDSWNVNNSLVCGENRGGCDQLCTLVENKPVCSCFRGFKLQGTTCHDIDECSTSNAGCEVACHNKPGSYECACQTGFRLSVNGKTCLDINECLLRNGHGPCQDTCYNLPGSYSCSCKGIAGTRLAADNHTCEDVDECARNNAGCSHTCLNTLGRAFCLCPIGFMLGTDWKTCHDIDECADPELQEGERCSIGCINTMGSYQCVDLKDQAPDDLPTTAAARTTATTTITTAATTTITTEEFTTTMPTSPATTPLTTMAPIKCLSGFEVGPLGSCKDVDECSTNNGGCSHTCKNTLGGAFCLCPPGFMLGSDWKTCKAMDVRSEVQRKITFICAPGHTMSAGGRCKDIDECAVQNGGCMQGCVNTRGSFRCLCGRGFFLAADGKSCIEERVDIVCPPLPTPSYGYLHCTRRAFMVAPERWRARWRRRIVNHAGAVCELRCPHGYKVQGEYRKVCESDGHWAGPQDGYCIPFPKPKIECPHNISVEVEPGQDTAFVAFPQPLTDVDWFKNVVSKPKWGKLLEADLQPGHWTVTFTARHPISRHTASCILGITVSTSGISTESSLESDIKH